MSTNNNQPTDQERADEVANDIVRLAEFLRANPDIAAHFRGQRFHLSLNGADARTAMADFSRRARRAGAEMVKEVNDEYAAALLSFGFITLDVFAPRDEVCERVVTGTREVQVEEQDAEALAAVPTRTVTKVEEIVEWQCTPLLAAADDEPAGAVA